MRQKEENKNLKKDIMSLVEGNKIFANTDINYPKISY